MKISRSDIRLLPEHPSLLLSLAPEAALLPPVVVDSSGVLIDGYRRFQIWPGAEMDAVVLDGAEPFAAARAMNLRTRNWDDTDCFLWQRWADRLGVPASLPITRFAPELKQADLPLLQLIASRRLTLRQAALILQSPEPYRPFFQKVLTEDIELNNNDTSVFIHFCIDLKKMIGLPRIDDVVARIGPGLPGDSRRQRGTLLLKELRVLRYPYYQRKFSEFSSNWRELDAGPLVQVNRALFLERGKLEITLTSESFQEVKESLLRLTGSLDSPAWRKIWEE